MSFYIESRGSWYFEVRSDEANRERIFFFRFVRRVTGWGGKSQEVEWRRKPPFWFDLIGVVRCNDESYQIKGVTDVYTPESRACCPFSVLFHGRHLLLTSEWAGLRSAVSIAVSATRPIAYLTEFRDQWMLRSSANDWYAIRKSNLSDRQECLFHHRSRSGPTNQRRVLQVVIQSRRRYTKPKASKPDSNAEALESKRNDSIKKVAKGQSCRDCSHWRVKASAMFRRFT